MLERGLVIRVGLYQARGLFGGGTDCHSDWKIEKLRADNYLIYAAFLVLIENAVLQML